MQNPDNVVNPGTVNVVNQGDGPLVVDSAGDSRSRHEPRPAGGWPFRHAQLRQGVSEPTCRQQARPRMPALSCKLVVRRLGSARTSPTSPSSSQTP